MKKNLVARKDVKQAIGMKTFVGDMVAFPLMRLLGLEKINKLYNEIYQYDGAEFTAHLLEIMDTHYITSDEEIANIPKEGKCIIVANHPFGGLDGIALFDLVSKIRGDVKILTNFLLSYIPNLTENFLPVNPFEDKKGGRSSFGGLRAAREHLENGGLLILFPSGEVSTKYKGSKVILDKEWQPSMIKFIRNSDCNVIPVYFDGANSRMFHFLGKIHPMLRTIKLPSELSNKKKMSFHICIGKPIKNTEISSFSDIRKLGSYLKNIVYALEANIPAENRIHRIVEEGITSMAEGVAERQDIALIEQDIRKLIDKGNMLYEFSVFQCFLAGYEEIPCLIKEIGRTRELSFRHVGEGSKQELDLDRYDHYYKHLILWDKSQKAIVGAYRLGIGKEIMEKYGIHGFYTDELFRYKEGMGEYLSQSIELGRSFVALEYIKANMPLMLLIKGLMFSMMRYTDVKYLLGPVSISAWYPKFYQSLFVKWIKANGSIPELRGFIHPKTPFEEDFLKVNIDQLGIENIENVDRFDKFVGTLSNGQYRLPTLVKKYLKLNSKVIDFNVDPDFNYCLDGLIMMNLYDVPKDDILMLCKGSDKTEEFLKRFKLE